MHESTGGATAGDRQNERWGSFCLLFEKSEVRLQTGKVRHSTKY